MGRKIAPPKIAFHADAGDPTVAAEIVLVPSERPDYLYLWFGSAAGSCLGTIAGKELKRLADTILRELARKP